MRGLGGFFMATVVASQQLPQPTQPVTGYAASYSSNSINISETISEESGDYIFVYTSGGTNYIGNGYVNNLDTEASISTISWDNSIPAESSGVINLHPLVYVAQGFGDDCNGNYTGSRWSLSKAAEPTRYLASAQDGYWRITTVQGSTAPENVLYKHTIQNNGTPFGTYTAEAACSECIAGSIVHNF